jgi:hypothetical protein
MNYLGYMETMLGIFLYSYPYLNLQNTMSFLLLLCLVFNKIGEKAEQAGGLGGEG